MAEDEMVGQHHQLNRHEFEQTPGDNERQGSLLCCNPWGHKESDMTQRLNNNNNNKKCNKLIGLFLAHNSYKNLAHNKELAITMAILKFI